MFPPTYFFKVPSLDKCLQEFSEFPRSAEGLETACLYANASAFVLESNGYATSALKMIRAAVVHLLRLEVIYTV